MTKINKCVSKETFEASKVVVKPLKVINRGGPIPVSVSVPIPAMFGSIGIRNLV